MTDGYYWARDTTDGTTFVVYREDGLFYCCGVENPINNTFKVEQILYQIKRPTDDEWHPPQGFEDV